MGKGAGWQRMITHHPVDCLLLCCVSPMMTNDEQHHVCHLLSWWLHGIDVTGQTLWHVCTVDMPCCQCAIVVSIVCHCGGCMTLMACIAS
jgi:hypothetical protein